MVDQEEIHRKCNSDDPNEHEDAVDQLRNSFEYLSDKEKAWQDLVGLTSDQDKLVRWKATEVLETVFQYVPDKEKAWQDLVGLTSDQDKLVRWKAAEVLETVFQYVPDKEKAWQDLVGLTSDQESHAQREVAWVLGSVFQYLPDKEKAWQDLHGLTLDQDSHVRCSTAWVLGTAFQYVPDKEKAWQYLHGLTLDQDSHVRWVATLILEIVFRHVPNKKKVWQDLHRLMLDENSDVRWRAAGVLETVFQHVHDKEQALEDLHRLTLDENSDMRWRAAETLGTVFHYATDKEQALEDLHRLTLDQDRGVRESATVAFGTVFQHALDKEMVWEYLIRLTSDQDIYVRVKAYHSLGRISIYEASKSETEEAYLEELKKAIDLFEKAAKESILDNPSKFCFPFYRSFYTIISTKKREAIDEVEKYLAEAKSEIGWSINRELLIEAIENLANALKEVQNIENMDLEAKKGELNFYRKYCEQAAKLMKNTEEKAPFATATMKKGLPILDRNLKFLLEEIQEKAKTACQISQGTDTEEIACAVSREVQKWEIGSQEEMTRYVQNLIFSLESVIPNTTKNRKIYDKIEAIENEKDLTKQYEILPTIIALIPTVQVENQSKTRAIESSATIAGFLGFVILEIINLVHPLGSPNDHFICLSVSILIFLIVYQFLKNN